MRYWLLIDEDALYAWSQAYAWRLPSRPIPIGDEFRHASRAIKQICQPLLGKKEDDLVVAEFECTGKNTKLPHIPFHQVDVLYGLSEQRSAILKDRYVTFGLKTGLLDPARTELCRKTMADLAAHAEESDIRMGAKAVLEMFSQPAPHDHEQIVSESVKAITGGGSAMLSVVFDYSRAEPWKCEGLMAGLCDLGKVLRRCLSAEDIKTLQGLSIRVAEVLKQGADSSYRTIKTLLQNLPCKRGFDPMLVLFMAWKYAAERRNGLIDIECVEKDIDEVVATDDVETARRALCLFGAFSGFATFADIYHQRMRNVIRAASDDEQNATMEKEQP